MRFAAAINRPRRRPRNRNELVFSMAFQAFENFLQRRGRTLRRSSGRHSRGTGIGSDLWTAAKTLKFGFWSGVLAGLVLTACAALYAAKIPAVQTPYWTLDLKANKLLGRSGLDDMDLSTCNAVPSDAAPCVVQRSVDFFQREIACVDFFERLKACEKQGLDR